MEQKKGALFSRDGHKLILQQAEGVRVLDVSFLTTYGAALRTRVCAEKLIGAQEFTDEELADPILSAIDRDDPVARNPCLRRGPLSLEYWTRLPGQWWRMAAKALPQKVAAAPAG